MSEARQTIADGLLVFFEGIDGTGKSTQLGLAADSLAADNYYVEHARAHGGTPIGEELRLISLGSQPRPPLTDLYISMAMHAALAEQTAVWRRAGAIMLIDRGPFSMAAYQHYGDGLDAATVWQATDRELDLFKPDLTIVYTAPVDIALARARQKPGSSDYFESKDETYFERVSDGYLETAARYGATLVESGLPDIATVQRTTLDAIHLAIAKKFS